METWRKVWRSGLAPLLTTEQLETLRRGIATDDIRLIQGATTTPPPLHCVRDWPVEAACAIGYPFAFEGETPHTVEETEEFFARTLYEIDCRIGEPAACHWFIDFFDETPRDHVRRQMLPEIDRELEIRSAKDDCPDCTNGVRIEGDGPDEIKYPCDTCQ